MINKNIRPTKLLWVDLEMTGLEPEVDLILEVALIITDFEFNVLDYYEAVIHREPSELAVMNEWCNSHHAKSGLIDKVISSDKSEGDVVNELVALISSRFGKEPAILAGNSIHADRGFIKKWWPAVDQLLHYRMLDVSSYKVLMHGKYEIKYAKKEVHRARNDIEASISELKYYIGALKEQGSIAQDKLANLP